MSNLYLNNYCEDKHVDLLLKEERYKNTFVLIKDFNTLMYDYSLYLPRKHFCHFCFQPFKTADALKCHIKDVLKTTVSLLSL